MGAILKQVRQESWVSIYCHNCLSWHWDKNIILPDGETVYNGHCGLESCRCINAVADKSPQPPPRFIRMEEVNED